MNAFGAMIFSFMRAVRLVGIAFWMLHCAPPVTGIAVVIDTDLRVPGELNRIEFRVRDASTNELLVSSLRVVLADRAPASVDEARLPVIFPVLPRSSFGARTLRFEAEGFTAATPTARYRSSAVTSFRADKFLRLTLFLSARCGNVSCESGSTCDDTGRCVPETVAAETLPTVVPGGELVGYQGPMRSDAGISATD